MVGSHIQGSDRLDEAKQGEVQVMEIKKLLGVEHPDTLSNTTCLKTFENIGGASSPECCG